MARSRSSRCCCLPGSDMVSSSLMTWAQGGGTAAMTNDGHSGEDNQLQLSDGRQLGYARYGRPGGEPILYFHGHPGSRLEARFAHAAASDAGFQVIALDRPGYGLSDFQAGRAITDWPADVAQLA